ncbi:MAG: thioredoxin-disulfide reductase [Actinobacteria bacterium]|nr:thioredoxin-disulfide reductase [Actinomycetota bacterium]
MEEIRTNLLIIGAGPGGLAAAIYARRGGLDFHIVEKNMAGGQIMNTDSIENYPGIKGPVSGFDLAQSIASHCRDFNIEIEEYTPIDSIESLEPGGNKINEFVCRGEIRHYITKSIIIATGASPDRLGVEGENRLIGRGVSFCATCDGALYRDREVAVVGGGDMAIDEALFLSNLVKKVYIIHRRDELRACDMLQCRAMENKKIEFLWNSVVEEFRGSDKLEEVRIRNKKDNSVIDLKVDAVFEYVGWRPNSSLASGLVETDSRGFIITDNTMKTSRGGIFAVGDVRNTPLRQVITAVSDGAVAAMYADKYLYEIL